MVTIVIYWTCVALGSGLIGAAIGWWARGDWDEAERHHIDRMARAARRAEARR